MWISAGKVGEIHKLIHENEKDRSVHAEDQDRSQPRPGGAIDGLRLSEKLQNVFKNLRGKGRLTEADVKAGLKEVKLALLEADVSFKVVKQFIKAVEERAVGTDVLESLTPGQTVIKIVNEEMVKLMGSETTEIKLRPSNEITVIMMTGLQGAGKTTTAAKLAGKFKIKGRKVLLTACDVYRPAAIKQLQVNGEKRAWKYFPWETRTSRLTLRKLL